MFTGVCSNAITYYPTFFEMLCMLKQISYSQFKVCTFQGFFTSIFSKRNLPYFMKKSSIFQYSHQNLTKNLLLKQEKFTESLEMYESSDHCKGHIIHCDL